MLCKIKSNQALVQKSWLGLLFLLVLALQACGKGYQGQIDVAHQQTTYSLERLKQALQQGTLRNAEIVKTYAATLAQKKPDLQALAATLAQDATSEGTFYQTLASRLAKVNQNPSKDQAANEVLVELENIQLAADPAVFNDAVLDIVNTLADLSDGLLPRVTIPKSTQQTLVSQKRVAGSYLVGNPAYGRWRPGSGGSSLWKWYGKYSLFRNIFSGSSYSNRYYSGQLYRNDWYQRPRYSYYHDYGRQNYGTRSDRSTWGGVQRELSRKGVTTPNPKDYRSVAGRKRMSTYTRNSTSNKTTSSRTKRSSTYSNISSHQGRRTSSYSGYRSSSRGTSSRSRSSRSGK